MKEPANYSPEQAEYNIFCLASTRNKFGLPLGHVFHRVMSDAFERGIDKNWWVLADISPITGEDGLFRIFKLTESGRARWQELKDIFTKSH